MAASRLHWRTNSGLRGLATRCRFRFGARQSGLIEVNMPLTELPLSDAKRALLEKMLRWRGRGTRAERPEPIRRRARRAPIIPLSADQRQVWLHAIDGARHAAL